MPEHWVTRDYGGDGKALNLSKSCLGTFVYHLFRLGGNITSTYVMNNKFDRSYVQMAISLPDGRSAELTAATGIVLEKPSALTPA